jgi:hypothetical protein
MSEWNSTQTMRQIVWVLRRRRTTSRDDARREMFAIKALE